MGTVFGKNTTSSSITVAGHKVYYIDSTDAEIVEVEKQGGGGSTASDDASGTISGVTLPTAHSYTGASFDSLRYYVKGTLSNTGGVYRQAFGATYTWYYGTITWEDSSLGDLSSKIAVSDPDGSSYAQQSVLRIVFISGGSITGYHAYDTSDSSVITSQITSYTYSNGVHSITFFNTNSWISGVYAGRIMFRYLDGVTTFNNLSAFDLINASGGSLSKDTTTDRYDMYNVWGGDITLHALYGSAETIRRNAFKYLLSGIPYWYVIDGEHDTWTDDLSAWGYSEVPVGPVLPEVSSPYWLAPDTGDGSSTVQPNALESCVESLSTHEKVAFNSSMSYGVNFWRNPDNTLGGHSEFSIANVNGYVGIKNVSNRAIAVYWVNYAVCSDSTATVVTVYDSSNNAYNAFKFTLSGTDYYYVLDGTQTDWVSDLSSVGYRDYIEATYYYYDKSYTTVSNNSWVYLYDNGTTTIPADDVSKYEFVKYYTGSTDTKGRDYGITLSVYNGKLTAINTSGSTITLQRVDVRIHS